MKTGNNLKWYVEIGRYQNISFQQNKPKRVPKQYS